MIKKGETYSLKPIHAIKYILWYIVFSIIITCVLITAGQINIKLNDSIYYYVFIHDAFRPVIVIFLGISSSYLINFATSESITHRTVFTKELVKFNYRFQIWIADFILLFIIASIAVIDRILNIDIFTSKDKLYTVAFLLSIAYFIKLIWFISYHAFKNQLLELSYIILFAIKLPGNIYQGICKEIKNSLMPEKYKKIFLKLFKILCIVMLLYIVYMLIVILVDTTRKFFKI